MPDRRDTNPRALIDAHRGRILELASLHGARNVRLFGSMVRGEATSQSDIDILIELENGRSLLDQVALRQDLEDLLQCRVDVVVDGGLSEHLEQRIHDEAVPL